MAALDVLAPLPALAADDGEWRIHARFWTGRLCLHVGDDHRALTVTDGRLTEVAAIDADDTPGPTDVAFTIPPETWQGMLEPLPAPFHNDWQAARRAGLHSSGSVETMYQYYPAIRRLLDLVRGPQPAGTVTRPAGAARFDAAVGRYVYLDLDGDEYRVYFEEAGAPDGIPILLQHTAGADGRQWRHVLEAVELHPDWRLIAYDLPFHGKSVPPTGRAWWAQDYRLTREFLMGVPLALSAALGLHRPVYMGSSIGGHLAADLARYHPEAFRAVVGLEAALVTPGGFSDWWHHPRISNEAKASVMYGLMAPTAPEAYRRETSWVYSQGAPPTFKGDLYYYSVDHDLRGEADKIDVSRCEVHLLTGAYDWASSPTDTALLAEQIPGASFAPMPTLGHFPMSEDPATFLAEIRPVLDGIRRRLA